jgi:hypothetical protein
MNVSTEKEGRALAPAEHEKSSHPVAKWAARIEDQYVPSPSRVVKVLVLKEQASIPPDCVLVRDYDGPGDVALKNEEEIDLSQGNVLYAVPPDEIPAPCAGHKGPKLAYFVDDRPEETLRTDQTGKTLRDLFGFTPEVLLFRDYESPLDQPIGLEDKANFHDGCVFYTRRKHHHLEIFVNDKPFTEDNGVKEDMTGNDIAKLVFDDPQTYDVYKLPGDVEIKPEQHVKIHDCERFKVVRKTVTGGYELARIERELDVLKHSGAKITFVPEVPGVVYHDVPARHNYPHLQATDVLVLVPGGYPGQALDGAYLPQGSPLLGRVAGNPQANTVNALGRRWQLVSYHPHAGGGAPPWSKDKHGFHTYVDELLTWVHRARQ